jgi:beta-lactamase regulating signal transducer with metallopeptidase domain
VETPLYVGLANALTAAVLAVVVAGFTRLWRRPALAHALWLLVLLKLITPPLVAIGPPWALPVGAASEDGQVARADERTASLPPSAVGPVSAPARTGGEPAVDTPIPAAPAGPPVSDPAPNEAIASVVSTPRLLAGVWLTGSLLWWTVAGWRMARFRTLLQHAEPAPPHVQEQARRLAHRLGLPACPGIWLLPARVSPLLWAVGRSPRLLLPVALWDRLEVDQRDTLLAHELAHLRRRDHWVRRLELVVLGLYWWHPVAWWARHELQEAEEQCCDAWVVWALPAAAPAYAAALVETVAFLSQSRRPVPVAASGVGQVQTLKRRLTMILRQPAPRALSGAGLLAVLGLGALLLPLLPTWAEQPDDNPPSERRADPAGAQPAPRAADDKPLNFNVTLPRVRTTLDLPPQNPKAKPADPKVQTPAERELAARLEQAGEEVALLGAQLQVKRAQLRAAQLSLDRARAQLKRFAKLSAGGALSEAEYAKAKDDAASAEAQLQIKEAELREPEVRLQLARRRLARLQEQAGSRPAASATPATSSQPLPAAKPAEGGLTDDRRRLLELEKKLDRLLQEVESLRKQIPAPAGPKGANVPPTKSPVLYLPGEKAIDIPFRVNAGKRDKIHRVILFVSADQGRSWKQAATASPDAQVLTFVAPADGLYWFNVATVDRAGNQEPADIAHMAPAFKIQVGARSGGN